MSNSGSNDDKLSNEKQDLFLEDYRRSMEDIYLSDFNELRSLINSTSSNLRNLLFTLATFLFTFSSPFIVDYENISIENRSLIFSAWLFLLFSILFGLVNYYTSLSFLKKVSKKIYKVIKVYSSANPTKINEVVEANEKASLILKELNGNSEEVSLVVQFLCVILGFVCIVMSASFTILEINWLNYLLDL